MFDFELQLELKEVGEDGTFRGIASVYGVEDLGGDVIEKGAFTKTIKDNPVVPLLWQHISGEVIGEGSLVEQGNKVVLSGKLDLDDPMAVKAYGKIKKKLVKGLSIGFQVIKSTWEEIEKNGVTRLIRHIQELKLWETSIVTFPMLPAAQITRVKSADVEERLRHIEEQVQALSVRSSTPVSNPEPEPRETKEPPPPSTEPVEDHSKLISQIDQLREVVKWQ